MERGLLREEEAPRETDLDALADEVMAGIANGPQ
jgi:hypothetical protein